MCESELALVTCLIKIMQQQDCCGTSEVDIAASVSFLGHIPRNQPLYCE